MELWKVWSSFCSSTLGIDTQEVVLWKVWNSCYSLTSGVDTQEVLPWTSRRSNLLILKEINPEYSLEGLMMKLKLSTLRPPDAKSQLNEEDTNAGKDWGQEEKELAEDEMVGWHHQLNGHEFEKTLGDSEGQGSLACCSPWGCKELDTTERLNNSTEHWFAGQS